MTLSQKFFAALVIFGGTFLAATLGAMASIQAREFYASLSQPSWAPPGWIFGPVWTTLYLLMAAAAFLVWNTPGDQRTRPALVLFGIQLAANALWSWLFFAWHQGALASFEVVLLWGLVLATLVAFGKVRPLAAWLLSPYLAWVSFATVLCFTVWRLNPQAL